VIGDDYEVLAHVTVDRRSRLRLPLATRVPARLWFRVHQGGVPTDRDPRILNFRAFRFEWERSVRSGSNAATLRPIGRRNLVVTSWFALQHVIDRLAKGGRLVPLTVPVSPRMRRMLKSYVEWRGFAGMARNAVPYFRRRLSFQAKARPGEDIFPSHSGLAPGAGWRMLDDYRGETFRRASDGAEVIIAARALGSGEIGLQVEPFPRKDQPLDLILLDSAGEPIAERRITGLAFIRFGIPHTPGRTQVLRLAIHNVGPSLDDASQEVKVYWCGWIPAPRAANHPPALSQPWGAGWRFNPASGAMTSEGASELVVRTPDRGAHPLFIDLETSASREFQVRDVSGALLTSFTANGRTVQRMELPLESGRTHVLELKASGEFRAYGCDWTNTPGHRATAFVHTNACGDFTLMAREHWFDLRGYPEFDLFSMNLDSVFCVAAHHGGAREEMLSEPMRIYHIEHGSGSGWTPEGQAKLFERIAARGLSFVDNEEVLGWAAQMSRLNAPMIFNHENWGLVEFDLKETVLPE
jgi:hypothetical protein